MSDLQISLLVVGALVVIGVYFFNWWQERQFHRRAEQAFAREHEDVLLTEPAVRRLPPMYRRARGAHRDGNRLPFRWKRRPYLPPGFRHGIYRSCHRLRSRSRLDGPTNLTNAFLGLRTLAGGWGKAVVVAGYDQTATWFPPQTATQMLTRTFALRCKSPIAPAASGNIS